MMLAERTLNTDRVGSNRTLIVEGGYYRVRCTHAANSDNGVVPLQMVSVEDP